uniref:Chromatin assembly factor 1 subunit FAS1 n=1 Tax=Noccaea caerulescens TaxID=107243 RepID=A0A1J3J1U8_NOCCA
METVMGVENRKQSIKRKRESAAIEDLTPEEKEAQISSLKKEIESLFEYFREMMGQSRTTDLFLGLSDFSSVNSTVALLMEEISLPLSKLVDEIFAKLKEKMESATMASVKSAVVSVGQRVSYGVPNADADVLEDDTESCLWCWETRELKMMPKSVRGLLKVRRTCRKKIHERITAVSAMLDTLQRGESEKSWRSDVSKANEKLGKVLSEVEIRSFMDNMLQKNSVEMDEKDAKREEKLLLKQLEKTRCEAEKEKKRMDRQILKEKLQHEKEQKLQQKAMIDENNKEKEESESRKRAKKQQDESEKEQKRREKEQVELKKKLEVQKQASIMERFLKRNKDSLTTQPQPKVPSVEVADQAPSCTKHESESGTVVEAIDNAFSKTSEATVDDLRRAHFASWRQLGHLLSSSKKHWGMRRQPKVELFPKLKLSTNRGATSDGEPNTEKQEDGYEEENMGGGVSCIIQCESSSSSNRKKFRRAKKLLQFDKSCRPGFYGIWPSQSEVVGPRRPLEKDPELDYEVDSDEEWEEEQAGESLSDCEDDEEEHLEEEFSKADDEDDDSEDDFMVPDGYLSEDEGVQVDRMEIDPSENDASSTPSKQDQESQEFRALLHQQKHLQSLTDHALAKTQPLMICNLMHEKLSLLASKDVEGTEKVEQVCLRALLLRPFPCSSLIEISNGDTEDEDEEEAGQSTPPSSSRTRSIPDSDLLTVVSTIQSCSQGINRVVETLQEKFPDVPKTKLRQKVREVSDFEDSRWQIKKEVLTKLGLSPSPDKGGKRPKTISTFFSKRCLPPSAKPQPAVEEAERLENENDDA